MVENRLSDLPLPQHHLTAKKDSGWWLGAVGTVLAIAVLLAPQLATWSFWPRAAATLAIVAVIGASLRLDNLARLFAHRWRVGANYAALYAVASGTARALDETRSILRLLLRISPIYTPTQTYMSDDRILLEFKQGNGKPLAVDEIAILLDLNSGEVHGRFRITRVVDRHYHATLDGLASPMFGGLMLQGETRRPPVNSVVVVFPPTQENADE